MSQPNQHTSAKALAAKAKTASELSKAVEASQPVIKSSDLARATLNEILYASQNKKVALEGTIATLQASLADELRTIDATEAALSVLDQSNHPKLVEREPVELRKDQNNER